MSQERQQEVLGEIRESETGYAKVWNEDGKTYFQTRYTNPQDNPIIEITQEGLDTVASGTWYDQSNRQHSFDGCKTVGGMPWSWGPCDKFERYLKSTGMWN